MKVAIQTHNNVTQQSEVIGRNNCTQIALRVSVCLFGLNQGNATEIRVVQHRTGLQRSGFEANGKVPHFNGDSAAGDKRRGFG